MKCGTIAVVFLLTLAVLFAVPALTATNTTIVSFADGSIPCSNGGCSDMSWIAQFQLDSVSLPNYPYNGPSYVNVSSINLDDTESPFYGSYTCGINATTIPVAGTVHSLNITLPNQDSSATPISQIISDFGGAASCGFMLTYTLSGANNGGISPPNGDQYSIFGYGAGGFPSYGSAGSVMAYLNNESAISGASLCPDASVGSTCNMGSYDIVLQDDVTYDAIGNQNLNMTCNDDLVSTTLYLSNSASQYCDSGQFTVSGSSVFVGNFNATLKTFPSVNFYQEPVTGMVVAANTNLAITPAWYGGFMSMTAYGPTHFEVYVIPGFTPVAVLDNGVTTHYTMVGQIMTFDAASPVAIEFDTPEGSSTVTTSKSSTSYVGGSNGGTSSNSCQVVPPFVFSSPLHVQQSGGNYQIHIVNNESNLEAALTSIGFTSSTLGVTYGQSEIPLGISPGATQSFSITITTPPNIHAGTYEINGVAIFSAACVAVSSGYSVPFTIRVIVGSSVSSNAFPLGIGIEQWLTSHYFDWIPAVVVAILLVAVVPYRRAQD